MGRSDEDRVFDQINDWRDVSRVLTELEKNRRASGDDYSAFDTSILALRFLLTPTPDALGRADLRASARDLARRIAEKTFESAIKEAHTSRELDDIRLRYLGR